MKNDFLDQQLALLPSPVLRKLLISGILSLRVVLLYFVDVEQGLSRLFYLAFATAIFMGCLLRFEREHAIVSDCGKAVVDNVSGAASMPKEGQSLPLVFKLDDPSISLPLSSFWFYEFPG